MPLVIGAVVEGVPATFQIPLSEHFCPVVLVWEVIPVMVVIRTAVRAGVQHEHTCLNSPSCVPALLPEHLSLASLGEI
uniref:Uncharacterized protein n=1 Tax=Klebsiella pneumoniae TaxID=573 RepID=A0A8B0SRG2_KLEPN|nr:hypothetical protein [Klebsiella pneumoniae]